MLRWLKLALDLALGTIILAADTLRTSRAVQPFTSPPWEAMRRPVVLGETWTGSPLVSIGRDPGAYVEAKRAMQKGAVQA